MIKVSSILFRVRKELIYLSDGRKLFLSAHFIVIEIIIKLSGTSCGGGSVGSSVRQSSARI